MLLGCGQSGPLYLPKPGMSPDGQQTPQPEKKKNETSIL